MKREAERKKEKKKEEFRSVAAAYTVFSPVLGTDAARQPARCRQIRVIHARSEFMRSSGRYFDSFVHCDRASGFSTRLPQFTKMAKTSQLATILTISPPPSIRLRKSGSAGFIGLQISLPSLKCCKRINFPRLNFPSKLFPRQ